MSRIAYVNGRYLPQSGAAVHIEDRGYQFADGVYEVCEVRGGRLVDERRHMARLKRSLGELRIGWPMRPAALGRGDARGRAPEPGARRHRLPAGDPRRRPPQPCLSRPRRGTGAGRDGPSRSIRRRSTGGRRRGFRSSPCRRTAGSGSTSSRPACCPMCSPSRKPGNPGPSRRGSSTRRASSRKARRPMPGS